MSINRHKGHSVLAMTAVGLATVLNYLAWLGWDQHRDVHADGSSTGPYEAWQIVGLVLILSVLAVTAGRLQIPLLGSLTISAAMTVSFAVDAASSPFSDGLWPIGAILVLIGTAVGTWLVATLAARLGSSDRRVPARV